MNKESLVISGFLGSRESLVRVAQTLEEVDIARDSEIRGFAEAMENPEEIQKLGEKRKVITHSAGVLAVFEAFKDSQALPNHVVIMNGPEPTKAGLLVAKAVHKTTNHNIGWLKGDNREARAISLGDGTRELFGNFWPNMKYLFNGDIPRFSTSTAVLAMTNAGVHVDVISSEKDEFFKPRRYDVESISATGSEFEVIQGHHDQAITHCDDVIPDNIHIFSR